MKENFLTIPDAPNYEINSQLICRNKKTGCILKKSVEYVLYRADGSIRRSAKVLWRVAKAAVDGTTFEPIPSLDGRYEINIYGKVCHARTKKIRKLCFCGYVLRAGGVATYRTISDLLWEVYGFVKPTKYRKCSVWAENRSGKRFFTTPQDCARFLAPQLFFVVKTIAMYLGKRREQIGDWKITYIEDAPDLAWSSKGLSALANRQAKLEGIPREIYSRSD